MHAPKEVMAWTNLIYDHFIIWPSSVTLTFKSPWTNVSYGTGFRQGEQLCQFFFEIHE